MVINKNIIFTSEYNGTEKPIKCKCLKCNLEWVCGRPMDLFKREIGCPSCAKQSKSEKRRKSQNEFEKDLYKVNPKIEVIGEYKGSHKFVKCRCKIDGYEWESYACNLLNGSAGCPKCNMSIGENNIVSFMERYKINYSRQKTFVGCKDVYPLKFDVFDEDNNIAIEFQGEQHYFPVDFETNNELKAREQFEALKKRDEIKRNYCNHNNIKLICIPYYERNNVENFLRESDENYKNLA